MKNYYLVICILSLIVLVVFLYLYFYENKTKIPGADTQVFEFPHSEIKLGEVFYLKPSEKIFYQNISFSFGTTTLPMHRNPVTGIEYFPYDIYKVNVMFHGAMSTVTPDGSKIDPKAEIKLTFDNIGISQKFNTDAITYELRLINYVDGLASFKLDTSFIEKHYERNKASFVLQITGGYFASEIYVNDKYVNTMYDSGSIHSTGFLINKYLSYEMQDVPEGKIVTPDMQGHNTIRIGPINTSSKEARLHVKIIDKLNPEAVFFDKDINFDTLGNNTAEIDLQIESDIELVDQQQTVLE